MQTVRSVLLLLWVFFVTTACAHAARVTWPLEYTDESTNRFVWDKRTKPLLESKTHHAFTPELYLSLGGPPNPVTIDQGRYFSAGACVPHDCLRRGHFWLDLDTGAGLGAVFDKYTGVLALDSTRIRGAMPESARRSIVAWLEGNEDVPTAVEFTDASGIKRPLPAETFKAAPRFVPPSGGPSFDCARASTRVERTLCAEPELAAQDLQLSTDYRRMLGGLDTLPDRRQLIELQRKWIEQRDRACEDSGALSVCLAGQYTEQQHALQQWIPRPIGKAKGKHG